MLNIFRWARLNSSINCETRINACFFISSLYLVLRSIPYSFDRRLIGGSTDGEERGGRGEILRPARSAYARELNSSFERFRRTKLGSFATSRDNFLIRPALSLLALLLPYSACVLITLFVFSFFFFVYTPSRLDREKMRE